MALAMLPCCEQEKAGQHYARRQIVFGDAGSSLESCRGVQLFNC